MPGDWVDLCYRREPSFFQNPQDQVMVGRISSGDLVAMGIRSRWLVYRNGESATVGYLSGLRVVGPGHNLWRGLRFLRELQDLEPFDEHLASIVDGNALAEQLLVQKRRRSWPRYQPYAELMTLALRVGRRFSLPAPGGDPSAGLAQFGPQRHYFPRDTAPIAGEKRQWLVDDGVACLRDLSGCRQTVVHRYRWPLSWLRPLLGLPAPGQEVGGVYAGYLCAADRAAFRRLLEGLLELARQAGKRWLYLGLSERDPFLEAARAFPHRLYRSKIHRVYWDSQKGVELDERAGYFELASL